METRLENKFLGTASGRRRLATEETVPWADCCFLDSGRFSNSNGPSHLGVNVVVVTLCRDMAL